MPDLGRYATEVLSAYAVSLLLLAAIVVLSVIASRRAKVTLEAVEPNGTEHAPAPEKDTTRAR